MNNSIQIIQDRVCSNVYLQDPPHRGSLQTNYKKVATLYDRKVWSFLYLVILQMLA